VRVLSLQPNPAAPVEIAHYDTFPAGTTPCFSNPIYAGNWGVYPLNPHTLVASDMDRGLFLLNLRPITNTFTAQPNPVAGGQLLNLSLSYTNASPGVLDGFGAIVATRIATIPMFEVLALDAVTLNPSQARGVPLSLPVPPGLPPGLQVEFTGISGLFGMQHFVFCQRNPVTVTAQ
jgi:hypothetical protein